MEVVKEVGDLIIVKKRNNRYGVLNAQKKWVNGDHKTKVLVEAGLLKIALPKPAEEGPVEAATEEAPAQDAADVKAE